MAGEGASDASSDSSNTYWDLSTCAAAVAAYATENPSEMAMDNQIAVTPVPFEVQEATGRQWVEASLRDPWRCYENFRRYYLVDKGYAQERGYLGPCRKTRY